MLNDQMVRGTNFTCLHAGPKEGWTMFRLEPPDVPLPAKAKAAENVPNDAGPSRTRLLTIRLASSLPRSWTARRATKVPCEWAIRWSGRGFRPWRFRI